MFNNLLLILAYKRYKTQVTLITDAVGWLSLTPTYHLQIQ